MRLVLCVVLFLGQLGLAATPVPNERLEVANKAYVLANSQYRSGALPLPEVALWSRRLWDLQKEAGSASADTDFVFRMKDLENVAKARAKGGNAEALEVLAATYFRLEAERLVKKR